MGEREGERSGTPAGEPRDAEALAAVFVALRPRLEAYARVRFGLDAETARDVASDAFVAVWLRRDKLSVETGAAALWDVVRARARRALQRARLVDRVLDLDRVPAVRGPQDDLALAELEGAVKAALAQLPPAQRHACEGLLGLADAPGAPDGKGRQRTKTERNRQSEGVAELRRSLVSFLDAPDVRAVEVRRGQTGTSRQKERSEDDGGATD